jgi:hypothetical protein
MGHPQAQSSPAGGVDYPTTSGVRLSARDGGERRRRVLVRDGGADPRVDGGPCALLPPPPPAPRGPRRQLLQGPPPPSHTLIIIFWCQPIGDCCSLKCRPAGVWFAQDRLWEVVDAEWIECLRREPVESLLVLPSGYVQVRLWFHSR